MPKNMLISLGLSSIVYGFLGFSVPGAHASQHAYVMILEEKKFEAAPHVYVALGQDRKSGVWNLPGGAKEAKDKTRAAAAARELFEETGGIINKVGDIQFWKNLKSYEFGDHKVFLITPGMINFQITVVDAEVKKKANMKLHHTLKEMQAYEYIKLSDLIHLANQQPEKNQWPLKWSKKLKKNRSVPPVSVYNHPVSGKMVIEPWTLYTIKRSQAAGGVLAPFNK